MIAGAQRLPKSRDARQMHDATWRVAAPAAAAAARSSAQQLQGLLHGQKQSARTATYINTFPEAPSAGRRAAAKAARANRRVPLAAIYTSLP